MNSKPKIALFAYSEPGYTCLDELLREGANVAVVFTHIDADDEAIWFHSVYDLAKAHGIPVHRSNKVDEAAQALFDTIAPDLIISAYYRAIIPDHFLTRATQGSFNLHGSLLPKYRGRAPINWVVLRGETQTGVTLHEMTNRADRGDIIAQIAFPIAPTATAYDVFLDVSQTVRQLIRQNLPQLEAGTYPRQVQDEAQATKFGRRRPADGQIDWQSTAQTVYNLIRAVTHPFPGAFTYLGDRQLFIWQAAPVAVPAPLQTAAAGTLLHLDGEVVVRCGTGALQLQQVELQGSPEVAAAKCAPLQDGNCFTNKLD